MNFIKLWFTKNKLNLYMRQNVVLRNTYFCEIILLNKMFKIYYEMVIMPALQTRHRRLRENR